jgi:hypothetical protein
MTHTHTHTHTLTHTHTHTHHSRLTWRWGIGGLGSVVLVHIGALAFSGLKMVPIIQFQFLTFAAVSLYRAFFYTALIAFLIEV